jgi:cytochrome c oxidase assembly factor CtaG
MCANLPGMAYHSPPKYATPHGRPFAAVFNVLIAVCVVVLVAFMLWVTVFSPEPQSRSSRYPDCSFDGNFANDKPGACPSR